MADRVLILIVAGQHSFFGGLENYGVRVLDVLNEPSTDFVHLHNVVVSGALNGEYLEHIPDLTIPKPSIDFVLVEAKIHEAPLRRKNAVVAKRHRPTLVLLPDYEIRGTFMLHGSVDSDIAVRQGLSTFFPITAARAFRAGTGKSVSAGVALVNKEKITLLHLERQSVSAGRVRAGSA